MKNVVYENIGTPAGNTYSASRYLYRAIHNNDGTGTGGIIVFSGGTDEAVSAALASHAAARWRIGHFLHGRYTGNGHFYNENSLSLEITDVTFDELVRIAGTVCGPNSSALVKGNQEERLVHLHKAEK